MAKQTQEIEVQETRIEEQEYWTCDDCRREFDEEELVPVAVDPGFEKDTFPFHQLKGKLEREVNRHARRYSVMGNAYDAMPMDTEQDINALLHEMWDSVPDPEYTAAASLDICPDCLETSYDIKLKEYHGERFDERNTAIEEKSESLQTEDPSMAAVMGLIPGIGFLASVLAFESGARGDSLIALIPQLIYTIFYVLLFV